MRNYLCILIISATMLQTAGCHQKNIPGDKLEDFGLVGDFSFLERSGSQFSQDNLKDKVWLASFVFTRCTGPCPQVCATLARLQEKLKDVPDFRIVTFTVDPERDNPMELNLYAENFRAIPGRWFFLTGKEETLHQLIREKFRLAVGRNAPDQSKPGNEFIHSPRIALIDKSGHIRGYFEGTPTNLDGTPVENFETKIKQLESSILKLAKEN